MAAATKKKQKMKGKTLNLTEFLGDGPGAGFTHKPVSWADEVENAGDEEEDYGTGISNSSVNRAVLPTAPRSARGPAVDMSKVPTEPPFTAFLGNLPFDVSEEEIEKFFYPLVVVNIRIPPGRSKGFGYAEFEDRAALLEALERNDANLRTRQIRIDLADQHGGDRDQRNDRDRDWGGRRRDDDMDDKTDGMWRRAPRSDAPSRGGESMDSSYAGRDRFGDRDRGGGFNRGGDRFGDRGGDRFGDRGGDRYGDRGGDRYGDRGGDRYGDRGGDRWGSDRGGDRFGDRGGDRGGDRFGDRDRGGDRWGSRDGGSRDGGRSSFGSGYSRDSDRRDGPPSSFDRGPPRDDRYGGPPSEGASSKERPRLNLQPRSRPKEEESNAGGAAPSGGGGGQPERKAQNGPPAAPPAAAPASSIFGAAKPVDTAAREREIEQRILREKKQEEDRDVKERERKTSESRPDKITRQDSDSSQGRQRKLSSSSSLGKVAPPPGAGSARVRRDSALSTDDFDDENVFDEDKPTSPKSPPSIKEDVKLVPAPPPKENAWSARKTSTDKEDHDKENRRNTNSATSPSNNSQQKSADNKDSQKDSVTMKDFVVAEPPKENAWARRKEQTSEDEKSPSQLP